MRVFITFLNTKVLNLAGGSVPSKKILRWANIWFSEHEHFNAEFKWITNFVNPVWEPLV